MKPLSILIATGLAFLLAACGAPDQPENPEGAASGSLGTAAHQPLDATQRAVDQTRASQDRLDAALEDMNSGGAKAKSQDETGQQ